MRSVLAMVVVVVALIGCPDGAGDLGERCDRHSDCKATLQCAAHVCEERCDRASDCGDGFACDTDGFCVAATGQAGDRCTSEVDCAAGLSCQIEGTKLDDNLRLLASCAPQHARRAPPGATCTSDDGCRNGTCALGRCVDLCDVTRDCTSGTSCMAIPRVEAMGGLFNGCLLSKGVVTWPIAMSGPSDEFLLPVPSEAQHASVVFEIPVPQRAGAIRVNQPEGRLVNRRCPQPFMDTCTAAEEERQYFLNPVRHRPEVGTSVLAIPSSPETELATGAYRIRARSIQPNGQLGDTPAVTGVVRLGPAVVLDLHFHFLDLADHPCEAAFGDTTLDGEAAAAEAFFQHDFLGNLRTIFSRGGVALGAVSYEDVHVPRLDAVDLADTGSLLTLGRHAGGVNVFFVRNLSPIGVQAYAPNPGPAGIGGTTTSGIIVGIDTLCYRSWEQLARLTAHEIARYMGLYHNVELGVGSDPVLRDLIRDNDEDDASNLMFYSELGGTGLSGDQRDILTRSPVLR